MAEQHPSAPTHPSNTQPRAITALAITAAALIFLLTGVSLWLSYEHLHDVGARHGFADDPIRAWAWPATLDLFYAAGEVLILRAALARRIDWWAISLVVFGAGGSIALNIAGVGENAHVLDYVVAAVPPVASLLAFGALMNQLYRLLAQRAEASAPVVAAAAEETDGEEERVTAPVMPPAPPVMPPAPPASIPAPVQYSDPRCSVIRPLYDAGTRPGTKAMRTAIIAAGYPDLSDGFIRGTLRAEIEKHEPLLASLPPAPVAITA
ncbi:DUF2637 domain-containing protein [Streptomyces europaeiscabiei]|uniref:DUF2637 domain-containing protein n=1 Tax=Streptomyces europaeiscabiei TaxID=146819 RepID=UPI0007658725|nr:DUF2637 domain-containing protein [Streptomyces europaeiscabiei]MDX3831369.1 DUF2637 domain-containing protein [Streptomyces europaeiscabiei]